MQRANPPSWEGRPEGKVGLPRAQPGTRTHLLAPPRKGK